jgi:uncharacterized protein YndB with AHSA1/START domain
VKITVETNVMAPIEEVWRAYTTPEDIKQWNAASDDWHTTAASVDLREGGKFSSRMEAKDGSTGFDFAGTYTKIIEPKLIEYSFGDRKAQVEFTPGQRGVKVRVTFDSESTHSIEQQRQGWQSILNNFARYVQGPPHLATLVNQLETRITYPAAINGPAAVPICNGRGCTLLELSQGKCRWPISNPGAQDFCFCGNEPVKGLPYCLGTHYPPRLTARCRQTDCVAGHIGLELRNVGKNYPFERSRRFPGILANSSHRDYSRLSCGGGETQLGPSGISAGFLARALGHRGASPAAAN